VGGESRVEQRSSKLGIKTNTLNAKFDFVHSKDFKLDSQIQGNSINTCVFKVTISVGAPIVIAGPGHQKNVAMPLQLAMYFQHHTEAYCRKSQRKLFFY
jgi:hypothetical protein